MKLYDHVSHCVLGRKITIAFFKNEIDILGFFCDILILESRIETREIGTWEPAGAVSHLIGTKNIGEIIQVLVLEAKIFNHGKGLWQMLLQHI